MLTFAGETFDLDEQETTFYGWVDPYGKGRKPGVTWDLFVCGQAKQTDVRTILPRGFDRAFDFPILDRKPTLNFSEMEIPTSDWKSIEGFSTEDCSSFSFYFIDDFDHLAMEACSLSFLKREGAVFTVDFSGHGGTEECGVDFWFQGLLDVPLRGIGMYFGPGEKDPVGAGRGLLKRHLPGCSFEAYDLKIVPRNARQNMTRTKVVFQQISRARVKYRSEPQRGGIWLRPPIPLLRS